MLNLIGIGVIAMVILYCASRIGGPLHILGGD